jgi:Fur family transcriptional regulator, ferric uptake regulator
MCQHCDYPQLLAAKGLDPTPNRVRLMEAIGNKASPLSAQEIFLILRGTSPINRVTVYRILDLLVEKGLVLSLNGLGRGMVYGLAPNENHPAHPHFQCKSCGILHCLSPIDLKLDLGEIKRSFSGEIGGVEIFIKGTCWNCLKKEGHCRS